MSTPKKCKLVVECNVPNIGVAPMIVLMDAFKINAEDAIDHLRAPFALKKPLAQGTFEICEARMERALKKSHELLSLNSDTGFMTYKIVAVDEPEIHRIG